jgi:hypothetical protein
MKPLLEPGSFGRLGGKTDVEVDGATYPVAALAVEKSGDSAAPLRSGASSGLDVGGANVATVGVALLGVPAGFVAAVVGGVIAENAGESVGSVNPWEAFVAEGELAAVVPIGGGEKLPVAVEGAANGASADAIDDLLVSPYEELESLAESDLGVNALAPNA